MTNYLSQRKTAEELAPTLEDYLVKAGLFGPSGSGKTTGAVTLPGKKLFIDFDGRKESLFGFDNVEILEIKEFNHRSPKAWAQTKEIKNELYAAARARAKYRKELEDALEGGGISQEELETAMASQDLFPWQAIVPDGLTSMGEVAMNWSVLLDPHVGLGGGPGVAHYQPQMNEIQWFIKQMLLLPCHVCVNGHLELVEMDTEKGKLFKILPKVWGKQRTAVAGWFNETYHTFRIPGAGETEYYWHTSGTLLEDFYKSTLNHLGQYWTDPVRIDFSVPPVGFERLLHYRFHPGEAIPMPKTRQDATMLVPGGERVAPAPPRGKKDKK